MGRDVDVVGEGPLLRVRGRPCGEGVARPGSQASLQAYTPIWAGGVVAWTPGSRAGEGGWHGPGPPGARALVQSVYVHTDAYAHA